MKKNLFLRIVFYVAGLLILALGIILNTKSGLGVSPDHFCGLQHHHHWRI